jgi:hypothetical protein
MVYGNIVSLSMNPYCQNKDCAAPAALFVGGDSGSARIMCRLDKQGLAKFTQHRPNAWTVLIYGNYAGVRDITIFFRPCFIDKMMDLHGDSI